MNTIFHDKLIELGACEEAIQWVDDRTLERAWKECHRGDWMLWLAAKIEVDRKLIVKAACQCARLALPHVPAGETRPLIAIETTEKWCEGEATIEEVRKAAEAAYAAAYATVYAAARAAYAAARAAAYAVDYAAAAVYAAAYAAAAYAAAYAACAAAAVADVRNRCLKECADIIKQIIPISSIR